MALSRADHLNTKLLDTTDGAISVTSGTFTPPANSLLCAKIGALVLGNGGADDILTANSGLSTSGLTWTKRLGINDDGTRGFNYSGLIEIWTAPVGGSPSSMTMTWVNTVNAGSASDAARIAIQVSSYTGYDVTTPTGATASDTTIGTSGTGAMTLSAPPAADSIVVAARIIDCDGTTDITANPGSGWTEIAEVPAISGSEGYACLNTQERTGSTSTAVAWSEINANSQSVFGEAMGVALEIRAAAGGSSSILPQMMQHHEG